MFQVAATQDTGPQSMSLVDLGKRLLEASKHGLTEEVRILMSNGAPFTTDWLGTSPLHFASQFGHVTTAEVLLRAGISRDARTKVDRTPLHVASQEGHIDIVHLLVRNGADVDAKDMLKMTPLHWAVEKGNVEIIQFLLQHGSETVSKNKFEKTAIEVALTNGRSDIAHLVQQTAEANGEQVIEEFGEITDSETMAAAQSVASCVDAHTSDTIVSSIGQTTSGGTAVLATLAALATANNEGSPQHQSSSEEATLKWLESQGITMISADNSTIVGNSVQQGQSLSLTEAGKLALNQMVKNKRLRDEDGNVLTIVTSQADIGGDQMVVNLNQSDLGTEITTEEHLELGESYTMSHFDEDDEHAIKRIKMEPQIEDHEIVEEVPLSSHMNIKLEVAGMIPDHEDTG